MMATLKEQFDKEHEHARLVLMLMEKRNFYDFAKAMRLEYPYPNMDLYRIVELWDAYCGMDGRRLPYLSIETGEPI